MVLFLQFALPKVAGVLLLLYASLCVIWIWPSLGESLGWEPVMGSPGVVTESILNLLQWFSVQEVTISEERDEHICPTRANAS